MSLTLVDTPGFNDTERDDLDVLQEIVHFLHTNPELPVSGILYFHNITERRMTGSARLNLRLLQALSGNEFFPRVAFVSTMWDRVPEGAGQAACQVRESQLKESPRAWGDMVRGGSRCFQYLGNRDCGLRILRDIIEAPRGEALPSLLKELRAGVQTEHTGAGRIIVNERARRERQLREELEEERRELQQERELARAKAPRLGRRPERLVDEEAQYEAVARGQRSHTWSLRNEPRSGAPGWLLFSQIWAWIMHHCDRLG